MFKILSDLKYQIDGEVTLDDPAEMKNTRRFLVRNGFDQDSVLRHHSRPIYKQQRKETSRWSTFSKP
eukprot:UN20154